MKRLQSEPENNTSNSTGSFTRAENEDRISIWYILLLTLAPLYLLVLVGAIVFVLILLDRHFISLTNFVLQQYIFIAIMIMGMAVAIIVYTLSINHAFRKIGMWRQNSHAKQANLGLLVLAIVASIMILPIILALFIH